MSFPLVHYWNFEWGKPVKNDELVRALKGDSTNEIYAAFTVPELAAMVGRGSVMADVHWQWLNNSVNAGVSGTVAYDVIALAAFVITALENGIETTDEVNRRFTAV